MEIIHLRSPQLILLPTSISVAQNGDIFVGQNGGTLTVLRYTAAGVLQESYPVATENTGSDWVELSSDQHTLFYTSQGSKILRYDIATHTQLPDYASLAGPNQFFGFAILPPGDGSNGILVADNDGVKLIDASGNEIASYGVTGAFIWTDVAMTLDGLSFWATSVFTNHAYKFDLNNPGLNTQAVTLNLGPIKFPFGVCIMPETDTTPPTLSCSINTANAQSGLFTIGGNDNVDTEIDLYITDTLDSGPFGPYSPDTQVKITIAKGRPASVKPIGQELIHIQLPGDPILTSTDTHGNTGQISCQ